MSLFFKAGQGRKGKAEVPEVQGSILLYSLTLLSASCVCPLQGKSRRAEDLGWASLEEGRNFITAVPGRGISGSGGGLVARQ